MFTPLQTVICESPKLAPHNTAMRECIAGILQVEIDCISIKATTNSLIQAWAMSWCVRSCQLINMVKPSTSIGGICNCTLGKVLARRPGNTATKSAAQHQMIPRAFVHSTTQG